MSFLNLEIKRSYISYGDDSIASAFLVPVLKHTKSYRRSVGFFSSGVFEPILDGIVSLSRSKGTIQLIASPKLSEDDMQAISAGYEAKEKIVNDAFSRDFVASLVDISDEKLLLLATLIARGTLDIKIAVTQTVGFYHDKLGILEDNDGNSIVFYGSANSSINGYQNNYEKIRVVRSWVEGERESVEDEIQEFNALWNGTNKYVSVYSYSASAKANLLQVVDRRKAEKEKAKSPQPVVLRDYQEKAIQAWKGNNYRGFYVMATGTGKTWTAIYSAKELQKEHSCFVVICAPYKHLVKQWSEDVAAAFPNAKIILVSSENPGWDTQIKQAIIGKRYNPEMQIIIISTIASFKMPKFADAVSKSREEKLLIVDEAHRFTERTSDIGGTYKYMLGLSATPFSGSSAAQGHELMSFFGGQVFNLPIEEALERKYLVPYYYHPIYVHAMADEEDQFQYHTRKIISCFRNNVCINPDLLVKSLRNRLRVISMASEKQTQMDSILNTIKEQDHFVVYCGDGKLFDDSGAEIRHIQSVKQALSAHGYRSSQFTATEKMDERMQLVDAFNKGDISALAAIRCLDEGINIPSIKSALILSSNDDYREFVQRRGRILRKYNGKEAAHIYDVIVLPTHETLAWARIELRRFYEYAKLALNWDNELAEELGKHLSHYGLSYDDVDVYDYENMEADLDE